MDISRKNSRKCAKNMQDGVFLFHRPVLVDRVILCPPIDRHSKRPSSHKMDVDVKYCNIYDLDTSTSAENYVKKLREQNILMTEREIENYKAAFHEHDEDGSGNISCEGLLSFAVVILLNDGC